MKFRKLNYFLAGYYHQDVWLDHKTHEDIWQFFINENPKETVDQLKKEVEEIRKLSDLELHQYVEKESPDGLRLDTPDDARKWIEELYSFLHK